jgi:hypothetical protein
MEWGARCGWNIISGRLSNRDRKNAKKLLSDLTPSPCPDIIIVPLLYIENTERERGSGGLEAIEGVLTAGIISGISGTPIWKKSEIISGYDNPIFPKLFLRRLVKNERVQGARKATRVELLSGRNNIRENIWTLTWEQS